jgi:hypothetical protein
VSGVDDECPGCILATFTPAARNFGKHRLSGVG